MKPGLFRRSLIKLLGGSAVAVALGRDGSSLVRAQAGCVYTQKACAAGRCIPACVVACNVPAYASCPQCAGHCAA